MKNITVYNLYMYDMGKDQPRPIITRELDANLARMFPRIKSYTFPGISLVFSESLFSSLTVFTSLLKP